MVGEPVEVLRIPCAPLHRGQGAQHIGLTVRHIGPEIVVFVPVRVAIEHVVIGVFLGPPGRRGVPRSRSQYGRAQEEELRKLSDGSHGPTVPCCASLRGKTVDTGPALYACLCDLGLRQVAREGVVHRVVGGGTIAPLSIGPSLGHLHG